MGIESVPATDISEAEWAQIRSALVAKNFRFERLVEGLKDSENKPLPVLSVVTENFAHQVEISANNCFERRDIPFRLRRINEGGETGWTRASRNERMIAFVRHPE